MTTRPKSLFLDKPSDRSKRIDRFVEHMRHAEGIFFTRKATGLPTPRDLLWILFQDAMHTHGQIRDQELAMVSRMGGCLPTSRVTIDEAYQLELSRLTDGIPQYDKTAVRIVVHQSDADRMTDILDLLRFVAAGRAGKDVARLTRTFLAHAMGYGPEFCTRIWDRYRVGAMSRQSLHRDVKERVIGQILAGIEREFDLVRTTRGFRRLTVREIEWRNKMRKREEARIKREEEEANAG